MGALKRTLFYDNHVKAGATLVDFGGWEMPIQYPSGIVDEHIHTRIKSGIFDVSHMGRFIVSGREATAFLQYVLTNNVLALDLLQAQYTMIPNSHGGAFDDAYLYRFYEDEYLLAFPDINPVAPVHVLVIPRKHLASINEADSSDATLLGHVLLTLPKIAAQLGVDESGYRVVMNTGKDGGQSVMHLHWHILGSRFMEWPPG